MHTLAKYLLEAGMTQQAFASAVKVSQPTVNRWLNGSKPSWDKAAEIERVTGGKVPLTAWADVAACASPAGEDAA